LIHVDAELEEFAMDPGSAPQRVGEAHGADQLPDFERLCMLKTPKVEKI
jgi:hypothetical protein